jgi:DNA-directed RNA polymerase subunit M/transcription elongation factor TFIIS
MGVNRFECRTCPYEDVIGDKSYYEKTEMKQKEVEDVFGGANEFANADSVASKSQSHTARDLHRIISGPLKGRIADSSIFSFPAAQCPAENCNGDRAYFFQLQIRSADEPMTTFLKVGLLTYYR